MPTLVFLPSLAKHFPKAVPVPTLLVDFGRWLVKVPAGGVGWFESLNSRPLGKALRLYAAHRRAAEQLGLFLALPDGAWLALWAHTAGRPPAVVWLGPKGGARVVASSLERFLLDLSKGRTTVYELDDDERATHRKDLARWLAQRKVMAPRLGPRAVPDLEEWLEETQGTPRAAKPGDDAALASLGQGALPLLGRPVDSPQVRAFATALGHWPLPKFRPLELLIEVDDRRGFSLLIGVPKQPRFVSLCFAGKPSGPRRAFAGPLPWGLTWKDTRASLRRKLRALGWNLEHASAAPPNDRFQLGRRSVTARYGPPHLVRLCVNWLG